MLFKSATENFFSKRLQRYDLKQKDQTLIVLFYWSSLRNIGDIGVKTTGM